MLCCFDRMARRLNLTSDDLAIRMRRDVVRMTHLGKASHVGSCLSVADVLAVLYADIVRVDPADPADPGRDRLIMSKGHAAAALYAVLAERGFFDTAILDTYYQDGSPLAGHVTANMPGVEHSTGSLGHGLSVAAGMALGARRDAHDRRAFAVLSDGECDEGSIWEPVLFAAHHRLDNLIAIVDYNKIQSLDEVSKTLALEPFADKWRAFGWHTTEIDGHDHDAIRAALDPLPKEPGKPVCVIAHTIKGKGVSFMERSVLWHYRPPDDAEYAAALAELGAAP